MTDDRNPGGRRRGPERAPTGRRPAAPRQPGARRQDPQEPAPRQPGARRQPPQRQTPQRQSGARRQDPRPQGGRQQQARQPAPRPRPAARRPPRPPRAPRRRRALRLGVFDRRVRIGFAAVCTLLLVITGRLVQLQGVEHDKYANAAAAQRQYTAALDAIRGEITDRDGTVLAYTSDAQDITADPAQIPASARAGYAAKLSGLLGVGIIDLLAQLSRPGQYALLARALPPSTAQQVQDLDLAGIYSQPTTRREYPGHTTAANIIGTVHSDGSGAAGIEYEFNSALSGTNGKITYDVDNLGNVNPSSRTVVTPAQNGATVQLTIDNDLQYVAQQYLDQAVPQSGAKDAEMAILDAHTGQVLALAASGTFDATNPNTINPNVPIDPPVESAFEPGSVQKAITFSAAIQQRTITPQTIIKVPPKIEMGGVTISDAWYHPTERFTATGVLAESSNVGTLEIAHKLGPKVWDSYEKRFGVGEKTGIELPGESAGVLPPLSTWSASTFANLPFGQGESMTVLQLASIYQTIANNGVRIPPRIVKSVTESDGTMKVTPQPAGIRVITPQTAKTVRTMLESVTLPGGTGIKAAIPGYRVAGKTGTAQQPDPAHGGAYSSWMNWDTFAGMVPADDPQFVVAIMVDNPAHGVEGGDVAAPLFHEIATYELQHAKIPPTGSLSKHVPLQVCDAVTRMDSPSTVC